MATLPAPDIAMDMSSPAQRMDQDHDIEIDLDDYPIGVELTDDERMVEDGEQVRPDTATDENMDEDEHVAITQEAVMLDEALPEASAVQPDYDDELIDYDEETAFEIQTTNAFPVNDAELKATISAAPAETVVDTGFVPPDTKSSGIIEEPQGFVSANGVPFVEPPVTQVAAVSETPLVAPHLREANEPSDIVNTSKSPDKSKATDTELATEGNAQEHVVHTEEQTGQDGETRAADQPDELAEIPLAAQISAPSGSAEEDNDENALQDTHQSAPQQAEEVQPAGPEHDSPEPLQANIDAAAQSAGDGTPSATDTGLHPVMVTYRASEFPLFKSRSAHNGLLDNDNLASLSLSELMAKCREQLSINTGEKISEEQELCLSFDYMRSSVREDDPHAFEFSLKEVLDVFVQLCKNDGLETLPAMQVTIDLTWKFSKLFLGMREAVSQGYGLSNYDYVNTANDDYYQEEHESEEAYNGEEYAGEEDVEEEYLGEGDEEYYHGEEENAEHGQDENALPAPEEASEVPAASKTAQLTASEHETSAGSETAAHDALPEGETSEDNAAASPATSATLLGDRADSATEAGEHTAVDDQDADEHARVDQHPGTETVDAVHETADDEADQADTREGNKESEEPSVESHVENATSEEAIGDANEDPDDTTYHTSYEFNEEEATDDAAPAENDVAANDIEADETLLTGDDDDSIPSLMHQISAEDDFVEFEEEETAFDEEQSGPAADQDISTQPESHQENEALQFDDEDYLQVNNKDLASPTKSPRGKRRLEDNADFDFIDFADDEPESKKVRAG